MLKEVLTKRQKGAFMNTSLVQFGVKNKMPKNKTTDGPHLMCQVNSKNCQSLLITSNQEHLLLLLHLLLKYQHY